MGQDPVGSAGVMASTHARGHQMSAGKLGRKNLGIAQGRTRGVPWPGGDFRDWAAIKAWADGIAGQPASPVRH